MYRKAILAGGLALAVTSVIQAQQPTTPPVPEDALSPRELIAWSSLQTPQPAQQQLAGAQAQPSHDSEQGETHRPQQQNDPQPQQEPARSHNAVPPAARDQRMRPQ